MAKLHYYNNGTTYNDRQHGITVHGLSSSQIACGAPERKRLLKGSTDFRRVTCKSCRRSHLTQEHKHYQLYGPKWENFDEYYTSNYRKFYVEHASELVELGIASEPHTFAKLADKYL